MLRVIHNFEKPELFLQREVSGHCIDLLEEGSRRYAALTCREELSALQADWRKAVMAAFPEELLHRNPRPDGRIISRHGFDGFRVENHNIASCFEREVNANIFLPPKKGRYPVIVVPTGHSAKTGPNYQLIAQLFAKSGYIAVLFDSIGQGEQSYHNDHFICGMTGFLVGIWSQTHFLADALCVMDYMQHYDEADTTSGFAMTGVSGGGLTTLHCAMLDDRIVASSPVCCISSHRDIQIRDLYSNCPECYGNGYLKDGLDVFSYIAVQAPKPMLLIGGALDDVYTEDSLLLVYEQAARAYELAEQSDHFQLYTDHVSDHAYSRSMAVEALKFFDRYFAPCAEMPTPDTTLELLPGDLLAGHPDPSKNMYEIHRAAAERLKGRWDLPADEGKCRRYIAEKLRMLLDLDIAAPVSDVACTVDTSLQTRWERKVDKLLIDGGSIVKTPGILVRDTRVSEQKPLLIFADDRGKFSGFKRHGFLSRACGLFEEDTAGMPDILSIEMAGFGELENENIPFDICSWSDVDRALSYLGISAGRPVPHYWVRGFLDSIAYMRRGGYPPTKSLCLGGRGCGALAALLTAALYPEVTKLLLLDMPAGYRYMLDAYPYTYNDMIVIPEILKFFDLPDILAALSDTEILLINPRDGYGVALDDDGTRQIRGDKMTVLTGVTDEEASFAVRDFFGPAI